VLTPLIENQIEIIAKRDNITIEQASRRLVEEKQPSGAFSTPEDIGELVVFLVGEHSKQVNGAAWTIDGCWTAV
jgi:3-hydroxybutyrate dehydrogenase